MYKMQVLKNLKKELRFFHQNISLAVGQQQQLSLARRSECLASGPAAHAAAAALAAQLAAALLYVSASASGERQWIGRQSDIGAGHV